MKLIFLNVTSCCYTSTNDKNTMNFILDDDSLVKIIEILEYIDDKLGFGINDDTYNGKHGESFKTKVTNEMF